MATAEIVRLRVGTRVRIRICGRLHWDFFASEDEALDFIRDYMCGGAQ